MGRMVWVGVGAVGGIFTYRKGERAVAALQAQEAVRVVRVVASVGRRQRSSSMAMHPASGGPARTMLPAASAQAGLRVGRFRITRTDETGPAADPADAPGGRLHVIPAAPNASELRSTDVVDITEAARRGRRAGVSPRRRAR